MTWRLPPILMILASLCIYGVSLAEDTVPCHKSLPETFREVSPSVLAVSAIRVDPFAADERVAGNVGSGFVIDDAGHVLASAHVVFNSSAITLFNGGDAHALAELVGLDPILDIAILKAPLAEKPMAPLRLGDSAALEIGEAVAAIGSSFGLEKTLTRGIVSGLNRHISESSMGWLQPLIQTDAAIGPGMSGGPLLNRCGEVVGVISRMMLDGNGAGFAVPSNLIREAVPQLIEHGRVIRPWYGVYGKFVDPMTLLRFGYPPIQGFLVETVEPGSPAAEAGLRGGSLPVHIGFEPFILGGDILVAVNGTPITEIETVMRLVRSLKVGDRVTIAFVQDGELHESELTLTERPLLPSDVARWK